METAVRQTLTPMLGLNDAAGAIDFYIAAFGAVEVGERYPYEGRIGHAMITIGDAQIMLADEFPAHNFSPKTLDGTPVVLHLEVEDTDAVVDRAVTAGAEVVDPPVDQPYGRVCRVRDPYGHMWMINGPCRGS